MISLETNRERLRRLEVDIDFDSIMYDHGDDICQLCESCIEKNLSPSNPSCEGRWCGEAFDIWLDSEVSDS